jgi:hypothetical protein
MESRPPLTIMGISHLRSIHFASIGGLAMVATVGFMTLAIPFALFLLVSSAAAGAVAAAIAIRRHRDHVIGTPGDDLPMALGLRTSGDGPTEVKTPTDTVRGGVPRLAVSY